MESTETQDSISRLRNRYRASRDFFEKDSFRFQTVLRDSQGSAAFFVCSACLADTPEQLVMLQSTLSAEMRKMMPMRWHNGYAWFAVRPLQHADVEEVPVHGGITFQEAFSDGSVAYGFDCNHWDSHQTSRWTDPQNVLDEARRLGCGIRLLAWYEPALIAEQVLPNEQRTAMETFYAELRGDVTTAWASEAFGQHLALREK